MLVSKFVARANAPMPCMDPHADPSKVPRMTSPLSFLKLSAFLLALSMVGLALGSDGASVNPNCVCNYDPDKDYFPIKLGAEYASNFKIEYFKSYKKFTVQTSSGPVVTYAHLCGTPQPEESKATNNSIQLPVDSVALRSASFLPYVSYIAKTSAIEFIGAADSTLTACIRKAMLDGTIEQGSITAKSGAITSQAVARTGEGLDLILDDPASWYTGGSIENYQGSVQFAQTNFGSHVRTFPIAQNTERSPLGAVEWLEVVAALFNAENRAKYVTDAINARYTCVKNLVAGISPAAKKKVVWGYYYSAFGFTRFYLGNCPNYYCQMIADAGGEMIAAPDANGQSLSEALALVAQADVWFYPDGNFLRNTGSNAMFFNDTRLTMFNTTNVVQNKKVFDILGGNLYDWFDARIAQPDVLLMDMVQAIHGTQFISASRSKVFLRNTFTEPEGPQGPRDPQSCVNPNAAKYTDWLSGPCAITGQTDPGVIETVLCTSQPGSASLLGVSPLAILVAVLALLVGGAAF